MVILITIALILVIVGALNWGLVGLFNFNLVSALFGDKTTMSKIIYVLVGIAGLYTIFLLAKVIPAAAGSYAGY